MKRTPAIRFEAGWLNGVASRRPGCRSNATQPAQKVAAAATGRVVRGRKCILVEVISLRLEVEVEGKKEEIWEGCYKV